MHRLSSNELLSKRQTRWMHEIEESVKSNDKRHENNKTLSLINVVNSIDDNLPKDLDYVTKESLEEKINSSFEKFNEEMLRKNKEQDFILEKLTKSIEELVQRGREQDLLIATLVKSSDKLLLDDKLMKEDD